MARRRFQMPAVEQRGDKRKYWRVRYWADVLGPDKKVERVRKSKFLGYCPTTTEAAERAKRQELTKREADRARNDWMERVNRSTQVIQSQVPFADFVKVWCDKHASTLAVSTQAKYSVYVDRYLLPSFGELRLCDLDTEMLQGWLNRLSLGWWAKLDVRNLLSSIFTKATDWGYWHERNPAEKLSAGKKRVKREKRLLDDVAVIQLIAAVPAVVGLIIEVCCTTGCRISEVLGLQWQDVDLVEGWVTIRRRYYRGDLDVVKSDRSQRELPLGDLLERLQERAGDNPQPEFFVFDKGDGSGEPYDDRKLLKDYIRPAARELGIYFEGFGFHSFRRGVATLLQEAGASTIEVQRVLGHAKPSVTSEYSLTQRHRLQELVRRMQRGQTADVTELTPRKPVRGERA